MIDVPGRTIWIFAKIERLEWRAVEFSYQSAKRIAKGIPVLRKQSGRYRERNRLIQPTRLL
jgi:hypothetical protein